MKTSKIHITSYFFYKPVYIGKVVVFVYSLPVFFNNFILKYLEICKFLINTPYKYSIFFLPKSHKEKIKRFHETNNFLLYVRSYIYFPLKNPVTYPSRI